MRWNIRWIVAAGIVVAVVIVGVLLFTGGGTPGDAASNTPPATIERIDGTDRSRLTLVPRAIERLGIQTTAIRGADPAVAKRLPTATVIPYGALLYDAAGKTYVYMNPEPMVFVREPVTVESIEKELVVLSAGPAPGTAVVTVGAAELYGLEFGIGT
jgi:hypothetical protein